MAGHSISSKWEDFSVCICLAVLRGPWLDHNVAGGIMVGMGKTWQDRKPERFRGRLTLLQQSTLQDQG